MRRLAAVVGLAGLGGLAGCPGEEETCEPAAWALVGEVEGAALAVQGRAPDDLWVVGRGPGAGTPLASHWDGERWTPWLFQLTDTLWWVWVAPGGVAWFVGDNGAVVRHHDGDWDLAQPGGGGVTFYGVWGASDDDVWIVGGVPDGIAGPDDDFILRWDGTTFARVAGVPARGATLFKVWGAAADDVWISGEGGTMLHWTGEAGGFVDHSAELATPAPALTVHGCSATEVYAVAGQGLYAWDGTAWARRSEPVLGSVANGVACGADGVLVVGNAGLKLRWERASGPTGPWLDERAAAPTATDLHGALLDGDGRAWAVGGNFNAPSPVVRKGSIGVRGCPRPGTL